MTSLVVSLGRLGDLLGRRRLKLAGIVCFIAASAACAAAPSLAWLAVARAAQGLGAAAMMAFVAGLRGRTGGRDRAGRVMGMLGAMSAAGTALGPSLGGLLLEAYGWRALFLALLPPGALALGLAWRYLPAGGAPANRPRFDGPHGPAGGDLAGLCAGDDAGARPCRLVQSGVAVPGRGGRVAISLDRGARGRAADPAGAAARIRVAAGLRGQCAGVHGDDGDAGGRPVLSGRRAGPDAGGTGLAMSAGPVAAALAGMPAGRLADRHGAGRMALLGLAAMAAGCAPAGAGAGGAGRGRLYRAAAGADGGLRAVPGGQWRGGDGGRAGRASWRGVRAADPVAQPWTGHRRIGDGSGVRLGRGRTGFAGGAAAGAGRRHARDLPGGRGLSVAALLAVAWRRA